MHSTQSRAEHVSLWERAVSALRVSGPGLSASVGVPAGGALAFCRVGAGPGGETCCKEKGGHSPPMGIFLLLACPGGFPAG